MTKTQVAQIIAARYQFGHYFCQLLERLLAKVPAGGIKTTLQNNLAEEMGTSGTYPGPAHSLGRKRLLVALGVDYSAWEPRADLDHLEDKLNPAAKTVITAFRKLIDQPNYLIGVSALATFESLVPVHYQYLVSMLSIYWPEVSRQDMFHLLDHIEHDKHHSNDLFQLLSKEEDREAVNQGQIQAKIIWHDFWLTVDLP